MKILTTKLLAYLADAALLVGIACALQAQSSCQVQRKLDAGLVESSNAATAYFVLRNPGTNSSVFIYVVRYNSSGTKTSNYNARA